MRKTRTLLLVSWSTCFFSWSNLQASDYGNIISLAIKTNLDNQVEKEKKSIIIEGVVTDVKGEPLPFAAVCFKGTTNGCVSTLAGYYRLEVPLEKGLRLEVSSLGYITKEIPVDNRTTINVVLEEDILALEEAVVVGYGSIQKKDLTGSVVSVKKESLELVKTQSVEAALVGQVAGLNVVGMSGKPGEGSVVNIRGLNSITGSNQPLYVIDGVPIITNPNLGESSTQAAYNMENPLLTLNPDHVERIDVLKDASAAAIYGSRAANGVILITTKSGTRSQRPQLRFSANFSFQNPSNYYDLLNASEYKTVATRIAQQIWDAASYIPEAFKPYSLPIENAILNTHTYFGNRDVDWQREIVNKDALWSQYNVSINGGTDFLSYLVAIGTSKQQGVIKFNDFDRHHFSAKLDANVTPWLKGGVNVNYNYTVDQSSGLEALDNADYRPDLGVYDDNGNRTEFLDPYALRVINPIGGLGTNKNKTMGQYLYGNVYGELSLLPALKLRSELNVSLSDNEIRNFTPSYNRDLEVINDNNPGATLWSQTNQSYSTSFTNTLNYDEVFKDKHKLNAVAGIAWDNYRMDLASHQLRGFPDEEHMINPNSANIIEKNLSDHSIRGLNSYFGRANYVYDDRYLATATFRVDGSTKFGPGNRYGFFPSGALAWNMHNESFIQSSEIINRLKIRASYGRTGSDNLPSFTYLTYYNTGTFFDKVNGITISGVPNEKIKWESTDQLDLGLEFGLWDYRFNAEVVYFTKYTSDIILYVPIPFETGNSSWNNNVADVSNKGWEFVVSGDIIRGDLTWNSSLNVSLIENKVEKMSGGTATSYGSSMGILEGEPIGVIYGHQVSHIAQTAEEIKSLDEKAGGKYYLYLNAPGDYVYEDITGDHKVNDDDMTILGDINPDFFGGWNNTFTYKDFSLAMNWAFSYGAEKSWLEVTHLFNVDIMRNFNKVVLDTWRPDFTDAPYARMGSYTHGFLPNSKSVYDASYLKLQTLSLSYNYHGDALRKVNISNVRLSATANNLWTLTNYPGLDPQSSAYDPMGSSVSSMSDYGYVYPNTRVFSVGVNVTF